MIITIDPGATTGWAVFSSDGVLVDCGAGKGKNFLVDPPWGRFLAVALVLVEVPVFYHSQEEKNPNSILTNGILSGRFLQQALERGAKIEEVSPPRKWKGTIGKPKKGQQYGIEKRVLREATAQESQLIKSTKSARAKSLNHNMIDAVGMGFWRLEIAGKRKWKFG